MSLAGHLGRSDEPVVEEFGHGLGPPTGVLVLRYPRSWGVPHFPEARDDHRHQLFWSPDGVLAVRHGAHLTHLGPDQAFWVRRGTTVEVSGCGADAGGQAVHVVCVRRVPRPLSDVAAATVALGEETAGLVHALCDSDLDPGLALEIRDRLLDGLGTPRAVQGGTHGHGLARRVASTLLSNPGDPTDLATWAERLHTCTKTLQRDFVREYGIPWSTWRTRMRLEASRALLGVHPVGEVAHRVGYSSASAYVSAFRKAYGVTPARWAAGSPPGQR